MTFDPPLGSGAGEAIVRGTLSSERQPGLRTDLERLLTANRLKATYLRDSDYIDFQLSGLFHQHNDGRIVDSQQVSIKTRARAGYAAYSACEGRDAPLPGGWMSDAFPQGALPQLPQVNR